MRYLKSRLLFLIFTISFLFVSCAQQIDTEETFSETPISNEELFRGIFFAQGRVAEKIHFFEPLRKVLEKEYSKNPNLFEQQNTEINQLVEKVKYLDPNYLSQLRESILSRDINMVSTMLEKGGVLIQTATFIKNSQNRKYVGLAEKIELDINKYDLNTEEGINTFLDKYNKLFIENYNLQEDESISSRALVVAFAGVAVVAGAVWEVAAAVNVTAYATVYYWVFAKARVVDSNIVDSRTTDMEKEKFIADVTFSVL